MPVLMLAGVDAATRMVLAGEPVNIGNAGQRPA